MRLGSGRRAAALVRAQTAPQHKGCGFEGLRFSCRLKGVFVHVNIDFCCCFCVWFGLVLAFFFCFPGHWALDLPVEPLDGFYQ